MDNVYRRIGFNTAIQTAGKIVSLTLGVLTIGFLTRYLGKEGFGNYTLIFAYLSFFGIIADCGFQLTMVRELSQKNLPKGVYSTYFFIKFLLVSLATLLAIVSLLLFPYSLFLKIGIAIASIGVAVGALNNFGMVVFQAKLRLDLVTFTDLLARVVTTLFIFIFIHLGVGFYGILLTILLGNLACSLAIIFILKKMIVLKPAFNQKLARQLFIKAIPVGIISVFSLLYFKIDTLILSFYRSSAEVGIYGLAYKIIENILVLWGFYIASVYPLLSGFISSKKNSSTNNLMKTSFMAALILGLVVVIVGYFLSPVLIHILGGEEFAQSVLALRILLFSVPFFFINNLIYHNFLARKKLNFLIYAMVASLIISIVLSVMFIPFFGYKAAAFNTVMIEVALACVYYAHLKHEDFIS